MSDFGNRNINGPTRIIFLITPLPLLALWGKTGFGSGVRWCGVRVGVTDAPDRFFIKGVGLSVLSLCVSVSVSLSLSLSVCISLSLSLSVCLSVSVPLSLPVGFPLFKILQMKI